VKRQQANATTIKNVQQTLKTLPMRFKANQGQVERRVSFVSRGPGYTLFLMADEAVLSLRKPSVVSGQRSVEVRSEQRTTDTDSVLRMKLVGANPAAKVVALDELASKSSYLIGNDSKTWRTDVPTYGKVSYKGRLSRYRPGL